MNSSVALRYRVSIKKPYKVFFTIGAISSFIMAVCCGVLSAGKCATLTNYAAVIFVISIFIFCGCLGIANVSKKVEVYQGKIIYCNMLHKKEYRMSDIYGSSTKEESLRVGHGGGLFTSSWDRVTTFYDASGKKLFRFGLAYNNIERLKKDVENTQKSIATNRKTTKIHSSRSQTKHAESGRLS